MYKSFYKLKKSPFEAAPDPEFLYLGPVHKKALSYLTYSMDRSADFIQLTGEIGCGKTMLILTLLKSFSQDISYAYVVNPKLSFPALLRTMLSQFGVKTNGRGEEPKDVLLAQMHEYLKEQASAGRRVLVILDEAQNMEPDVLEELRMLSNLDTGIERPLHTIFVGHPEFRSLIADPALAALKQRISVAAHLPPLTRQETEKYIACRLRRAGANGEPAFTPKAVDRVFKFSGGIPRLINLACESSLLAGYIEEVTRLDGNLVGAVVEELEEDLSTSGATSPSARPPKDRRAGNGANSEASGGKGVLRPEPVGNRRRPVKQTTAGLTLTRSADLAEYPEDTETRRIPRRKRPARTRNGFLKSKKMKIAFFSTVGFLGSLMLGVLAYLLA